MSLSSTLQQTVFMEEMQCQDDLSRVEAGVVFREGGVALHEWHEVPSASKLCQEVQSGQGLEASVHGDEKWMLGHHLKDVLLCLHPSLILLTFTHLSIFINCTLAHLTKNDDG